MEIAAHLTAMGHLMGVVVPATGHPHMVDVGVVMVEVDDMETLVEAMEVVA